MRKVTIELSDKDAEWLIKHEPEIAWINQHKSKLVHASGVEPRVVATIAKTLVDTKKKTTKRVN